jgi:hypothetical protein
MHNEDTVLRVVDGQVRGCVAWGLRDGGRVPMLRRCGGEMVKRCAQGCLFDMVEPLG